MLFRSEVHILKTQYQLPAGMVPVIRGDADCGEDLRHLAETGRLFYQYGKDETAYSIPDAPASVSPAAAEFVGRFLLACWELGQSDRVSRF